VYPDIIDVLTCLRAVALYKDETRTAIRPLGVGEALRRIVGRSFAAQERSQWARFFTTPLAEDVALNEERIQAATAAAEAARATYVTAAATTAPEAEELRRRLDEDEALEEQHAVSMTPDFPVNYAFSSCGTEMAVHYVQGWFEAAPEEPKTSDDKMAMYNSVDRSAMFAAMRAHPEFRSYIALYHVLYGKPARIFLALARGEGEIHGAMVPRAWLTDLDEEDGGDGDLLAFHAADARPEDYIELTGDRASSSAAVAVDHLRHAAAGIIRAPEPSTGCHRHPQLRANAVGPAATVNHKMPLGQPLPPPPDRFPPPPAAPPWPSTIFATRPLV
jgi:hypothetical protein